MLTHESKWHVAYTLPRTEKKLAETLTRSGIECYLPLHAVFRQWSDRKKKVSMPLFPNYVFLKLDQTQRARALSMRELVRFVAFSGKPVVVPEKEILDIQRMLTGGDDVEIENYFEEGSKVRIDAGPFAGFEGIITKRNNQSRLVVKVHSISKAFSINLEASVANDILSPIER
jgi:transcription antitermination factor NusG